MTKRLTLLAACVLILACGAPCGIDERNGDWTYTQEREWTLHGGVCVSRLQYQGNDVWAGRRLMTPMGTFRLDVSEHGDEDNGWRRVSHQTSADVSIDPAAPAMTYEILRAGFYASPETGKAPGTPNDWVYVGGVNEPGWASPARLRDPEFIRRHRPILEAP
jgi:hypothetical protein